MSEPLIFVRWREGLSNGAKDFARKERRMKRVPSEEWDKVGIELYSLPPGLAKKSVEWLIEKGWAEAEEDGDAEGVPIDPDQSGLALSLVTLADGATWYQQRVGLPEAWGKSMGNGVKIGVADSGANHEHEWLKDSIVASKNFVDGETTVNDNEGHGTACAGLVKAVAKDASLFIARVMSQNSAKWTAVGAGWIWLADQGCVVASTSIGGSSDSFSLSSAAFYCNERNCIPLCAAGNAGTQTNSYPANTRGCIAVSATDGNDNKAGFSQWGEFIDIAAPGTSLLTSYGSGYQSFSGTSGSTPIVAGCIGLVAANYGKNGTDALNALMLTCRNLGNDLYFGAGIPDLLKALAVEAPAPEPPPPPPDPEPPPPEPPPPTSGMQNITKLAQWQTMVPAFEPNEGLAKLTDGNPKTKCLHFNQWTEYIFDFGERYFVDMSAIWSANDYPQRDAQDVFLYRDDGQFHWTLVGEWTGNSWTARFQKKEFTVTAPRISARMWKLYCGASGQTSPGDKGTGILQIADIEVWGEKDTGPIVPPPPEPVKLPDGLLLDLASIEEWIPHLSAEEKPLLKVLLSEITATL